MVIYCTNDLLSAHTKKRSSYFEYFGINYELCGISNLSNQDNRDTFNSKYTTENKGLSRYIVRLYYAIRIVRDLRKRSDVVIVFRGWEFLLVISVLKHNYFFELTDIPNVILNSRSLMRILELLCSKASIISTSPAYLKLLKSDGNLIWHNTPFLTFQDLHESALTNSNKKVLYAGYLRGIKTLQTHYRWLYLRMDFFGKRNILNSSADILGENYFGEYFFDELKIIYSNYTVGYVSDFYGPNSMYNLTNRIYEVIFNGCIPVHVKTDATSNYLDNIGIFYIASKEQFEYVCTMDLHQLKTIANSNHRILQEIILKDFSMLNLLLR